MTLTEYIARQFGHPTGLCGRLATWLMNVMNRKMYDSCRNAIRNYSPQRVLDIGFGNGYMLKVLSKETYNPHLK